MGKTSFPQGIAIPENSSISGIVCNLGVYFTYQTSP
jgi:hypothetical protein